MREIVISNEVIKTQDYIRSDDKYKCYVTVIWHKWGLDHNDDSNVILYPDVTYHIPTTEKWETTTLNHGKFLIKWLKQHTNYNISFNLDHYSYVYKELKKELGRIKKGDVRFKQEPCILHVACKTLNDAQKLLKKAQSAGWKRSGIISSKEGFVCELMSTEKLEFPIISNGKILVGDDFLKIVIKKSNENLKKSWDNIWGLEKSI